MRDTINMAREAGAKDWQKINCDVEYLMSADALKAFEALVRADEREACAKVCYDLALPPDVARSDASIWEVATLDCAEAIRARSNT